MKYEKVDEKLAVIKMSRKDTVRLVHQLIDQLNDTGGCGSDAYPLQFVTLPTDATRVAFMLEREPKLETEYYFYVGPAGRAERKVGGTRSVIVMTRAKFFNEEGHIEDKYLRHVLREFLPASMSEESPSEFWDTREPEEVRKDLLLRGFIENPRFSVFAQCHDPFCVMDYGDEDEEDDG